MASELMFVYGTLKQGFVNHERYLSLAEQRGGATLLGPATTCEPFPMVIRPVTMLPSTCGPVLMAGTSLAGKGRRIAGEVWRCDASTMAGMDLLEGVGSGQYFRRDTEVQMTLQGDQSAHIVCVAYFYPPNEVLFALPHISAYGVEEHELYQPGSIRPAIVELCAALPREDLLRTVTPAAMAAHCLRLLPGQDLLKSLDQFVKDRGITAAVVLTCVGSTARTVLRPAGSKQLKTFEGKFEIVSLTGTLGCNDKPHIHMSVSDAECNVFGGHVVEGSTVRTTAEIALGVLPSLQFTRALDARSGYGELVISAPKGHHAPPTTCADASGHKCEHFPRLFWSGVVCAIACMGMFGAHRK